jgi:alpha-D-ribose 1-methylphosphonate 5-triphosphate synthase subunit PhnI
MGYTAVKGGLDAILAAEALISAGDGRLNAAQVGRGARLLIDQVMGEGGLYAPELAALAIAQAEGDPIEAAFLLRAYRSTLPRIGYTLPSDGRRMRVLRRISSTFKDIPGGQVLGRTRDYTQRLLDVDGRFAAKARAAAPPATAIGGEGWPVFPSVVDALREEGLVRQTTDDPTEPADITRDALRFPAPRSARLQALARGETGFMVAIGYSAQRGLGAAHPTIAELRSGELPLQIATPFSPTTRCPRRGQPRRGRDDQSHGGWRRRRDDRRGEGSRASASTSATASPSGATSARRSRCRSSTPA